MFKAISQACYDIPDWMRGTRFETLILLDKWLEGTFYDKLSLHFNQEKSGNQYNPLHTRRPSIQLNLPQFVSGLCARKLFGGRHIPRLKHENKEFLLRVQALVEELRAPQKLLEAVKRGSVGSVLILFKILATNDVMSPSGEIMQNSEASVKGSIEIVNSQYCTPVFNQFEELTSVLMHYICSGGEMLGRNLVLDCEGDPVKKERKYWYVKMYDSDAETLFLPIKEHKWNPVDGGSFGNPEQALVVAPLENNPYVHNLGFVQGIWIKNLTGGKDPDGLSTWGSALNNFIQLDYISSQLARGLNYASAPQLVIKGDFRAEAEGETDPGYRDPAYMLRLAADMKDANGGESRGHDAFLLETNGMAAKSADDFLRGLKRTSFEQICAARKDLESIKGAISGKALELIDEDFLDLLQELRVQYGTCGYLQLIKKICKAASIAGHPLMANESSQMIDGLVIDFPPMYLPDPQEIQFLSAAFATLTLPTGAPTPGPAGSKGANGQPGKPTMLPPSGPPLVDPAAASLYLAKQLDLVEESEDKPVLTDTNVMKEPGEQSINPEDPILIPGGLSTGLQDDLAVKPMTGLNPMNIPQ